MSSAGSPMIPLGAGRIAGVAGVSPLSEEQFAEIQSAQTRAKKIRRAVAVATFDAWCSSIFAGVTVLSALLSPISLVLGIGLSLTAFNSFRGLRLLKRTEVRAAGILALNQIGLAAMVIVYAAYSLWDVHRELADPKDQLTALLRQLLGDNPDIVWNMFIWLYGGLILATIATQGLTALYYHTRKKYIIAYLRDTPAWVIELQKKQAGP